MSGIQSLLRLVHVFQLKTRLCTFLSYNNRLFHSPILPLKVQKLTKNEVLMVNIGSLSTGGRVLAIKADLAKVMLTGPVCTDVGEKIALSRRVDKHWR